MSDPAQAAAPPRAVAAGDQSVLHALVRVQGHTVAIPGDCVTQAVEAPAALTPVPRRAGAIEGVMTIGRSVVPVVGLARWLQPGSRLQDAHAIERAHGLVLLLRHEGACVGLAVEAVIGTHRIPAGEVRRLFHDDDPEELFQSAALFGGDTVPTSILEPGRLMALAGVWVADAALDEGGVGETQEAAATAAEAARAASTAHAVGYAVFRIADAHVGVPAANVGELLRLPTLRRELLPHDGVLGLCEWRGRLVPVVDLCGALHAVPAEGEAPWVCIVAQGDLAIGVVTHEVLEIAKVAPDAGVPEDAPPTERPVVARRLVKDGRTVQLLDVALLLARYAETAISADGTGSASRQARHLDRSAPAYMVFDAGGMFAAPIDGVQEVIPVPEALRAQLDAGGRATLQWRDQPVPVLAIDDGLVALPAQSARQLIVIRRNDTLSALAIVGVKAMVPRGIAQRTRMRIQGGGREVISVQTEDHRASYPVVDLGATQPAQP